MGGMSTDDGFQTENIAAKGWNGESNEAVHALMNVHLPSLDMGPVMAPFEYICSLKSKGVRDKVTAALGEWIPVTKADLELVNCTIADVHNTSLMLDDVQDGSALRRSCPATHTIFGTAQTVNSATFQTVDIIGRLMVEGGNPSMVTELVTGMRRLLVGQSLDLLWSHEVSTPTIEQYLRMVDQKTGALFMMIYRLMKSASLDEGGSPDLKRLMLLLGRYFQIRDDYANIASADYAKSKGFCEDLDEGKCSFIILHAMSNAEPHYRNILRNILLQRRGVGCIPMEHKTLVLSIFQQAGSLQYTVDMLGLLADELICEVGRIEQVTGKGNAGLRGLIETLRV